MLWELEPAHTRIDFSVGDILHKVHGSFQLRRGAVHFDPDGGKASGEIVVDVTSGDTGGGARDRRMHKEILQSDLYPEAVFTPDSVEGRLSTQGTSEVDIHGRFRIHGSEHDLTLHTQVQVNGVGMTARSQFVVPYSKWGMKNPSTFLLRVSDHVDMDLHAAGTLAGGAAADR
jgi:polyisoprenoid-binding protein YceI